MMTLKELVHLVQLSNSKTWNWWNVGQFVASDEVLNRPDWFALSELSDSSFWASFKVVLFHLIKNGIGI